MIEPNQISRDHRSYICLQVFVLVQHGYFDRALLWLNVLYQMGDRTEHVLFSRATALFLSEDYAAAINALQELDARYPTETFGEKILSDKEKMRTYMKIRSQSELKKKMAVAAS